MSRKLNGFRDFLVNLNNRYPSAQPVESLGNRACVSPRRGASIPDRAGQRDWRNAVRGIQVEQRTRRPYCQIRPWMESDRCLVLWDAFMAKYGGREGSPLIGTDWMLSLIGRIRLWPPVHSLASKSKSKPSGDSAADQLAPRRVPTRVVVYAASRIALGKFPNTRERPHGVTGSRCNSRLHRPDAMAARH